MISGFVSFLINLFFEIVHKFIQAYVPVPQWTQWGKGRRTEDGRGHGSAGGKSGQHNTHPGHGPAVWTFTQL